MNIDFQFLSAEERAKLPKEDFGDPDRMLFPILTQEDVDTLPNRLLPDMTEIKNRIIEIARRKGFTLPESMVPAFSEFSEGEDTKDGIGFASEAMDSSVPTADGEYVLRTGKIFQAGTYPDKKFEMSPEELCEAVSQFKPVDIDLEHMPTILDGKLGKLEAVALGSDGWSMVGTVRLPKWLDSQLGDSERKVSATWDRATKRLKKLALVRNPRVKDASLFAAFTADELVKSLGKEKVVQTDDLVDKLEKFFDNTSVFAGKSTWDGKYSIQQVHDMAARNGAICDESNQQKSSSYSDDKADFVSAAEAKVFQQVHDTAVRGGAKCSFIPEGAGNASYNAGNEVAEGSGKETKENKEMNFKDVISYFKGLPEDTDLTKLAAESNDDAAAAAKAEETKKAAELAAAKLESEKAEAAKVATASATEVKPSERELALEEELKKLRLKDVQRGAEKFADEKIKEGLAVPHERSTLIALFTQATIDDGANETKLEFKSGDEDKSVSRVEALEALYSVRKPHGLTKEQVEGENLGVLVTNSGDEDESYLAQAEEQARKFAKKQNKAA